LISGRSFTPVEATKSRVILQVMAVASGPTGSSTMYCTPSTCPYKDGSEKGMIQAETCSEFGHFFLQILSNDDVQLSTHS